MSINYDILLIRGDDKMGQTNINIRMDEELKEEFNLFCEKAGLNMSVAINMFARATVNKQRIPFPIEVDPFYSKTNIEHLKRAIRQLEDGNGVEHELIEADDEEDMG